MSHSFIIETCHAAAASATYAHRAKIKVDDFKFALRKDPRKLGRVTELLVMDKTLKRDRKAFEVDDDAAAQQGGEKKKRRGRHKKVEGEDVRVDGE